MVERHKELESFLGDAAQDPAFDELEDRAYDAAHLEEEQYALLLEAGTSDDSAVVNLKRHVLFCDVCSSEFLRRAAPRAEADFVIEAAETSLRRGRLLLFVSVVLALVLGFILGRLGRVAEPASPEPPPFVTVARAGLGDALGRADAADRIFVVLEAPEAGATVHLYAYLVAGPRVVTLHPTPGGVERNPVAVGMVPAGGWPDPGGPVPRWVIGLASDSALPLDPELATRLRSLLADGKTVPDLVRTLDQLLGDAAGISFAIRIDE